MNRARGEATAEQLRAQARSTAITQVAEALQSAGAKDVVALQVCPFFCLTAENIQLAEQYVGAFSMIAQKGNTILMPANVSDPSVMIAQALAIYKNIQH